MSKTIALLDEKDEMLALSTLLRDSGFEITTHKSIESLFGVLHSQSVDMMLVILQSANQQIETLLETVKGAYPQVLRIALSHLSDSKAVFKAIEANLARILLYKAWDLDAVLEAICKLFDMEERLRNPQLLALINSINVLPTLPMLYQEVSTMIANDIEVDRIASLIEQDPAIASSILRVANSAFYGAKTGSISQAIMFIGLGNVKNIILGHSAFMQWGNAEQAEVFWQHAVQTNRYAHLLYEYFHKRKMPLVNSSAGLLHNVGIMLLASHYKKPYMDQLDQLKKSPETVLIQVETEMFSIDHAALGAYLLNLWELPLNIVEVAMHHHEPSEQSITQRDVVAIVYLAAQCSWYRLFNNSDLLPDQEVLFPFGLSQQVLLDIISE